MSEQEYSDELINSFIDGELDNEERACLLFAEQEDKALAERINEAGMLKEKVRLAYAELSVENTRIKPFSCAALLKNRRSLVAGILLLAGFAAILLPYLHNNDELVLAKQLIAETPPLRAEAIKAAIGESKRVVIHVSQYEQDRFGDIINEIEALLAQNQADDSLKIEIVANRQGLRALDMLSSKYAGRVADMAQRFDGLEVVACAKTLAKLVSEGDPIQLMRSIMMTPTAAHEVAKRRSEGWLYIKV